MQPLLRHDNVVHQCCGLTQFEQSARFENSFIQFTSFYYLVGCSKALILYRRKFFGHMPILVKGHKDRYHYREAVYL